MMHFLRRWPDLLDLRLKLILISVLVGVFGGIASVLLQLILHKASEWLAFLSANWYSILFPMTGFLLVIVLMRVVFRDQDSHGVPEVIYAISKRGGLIRLRTSISRLLACMVTLASGGSAGPEAPVVISGASIGSNIASRFNLKDKQRSVVVGCGASAAIAAIFNAPVTGIIFTMESVVGEWTRMNLIPISIASVVGTIVSRVLQGNPIPFAHRPIHVSNVDIIACIGLSILTAMSSILLVRCLKFVEHLFATRINSPWLRATVGGILVGAIGFSIPAVLGEGYDEVQTILSNSYNAKIYIIGLIIVAKIIATSLTSGAGGVGGVFAPCLVIGAMTGLLYHDGVAILFPDMSIAEQGYYGLLGMAGVVSSVLQAPLTGIFLVIEITGGHDVLLSVVLVSVLSATISGFVEPFSIYRRELIRVGSLLQIRSDSRILNEMGLVELIETDCIGVSAEMKLREFVQIVSQSNRNYFPVEDNETGDYIGLINLATIRNFLFEPTLYDSMIVEEFIDESIPAVRPDDDLMKVIAIMESRDFFSLPVVEHGRFFGLVSKATLLDNYRQEMIAQEET